MNEISPRYVGAVARHLVTRLDPTTDGVRCRCGQCRHMIRATANRTGIPVRRLLAALPPEREAEPERKDKRRKARTMTSQLASSMRVARAGRLHEGPAAVLALLEPVDSGD